MSKRKSSIEALISRSQEDIDKIEEGYHSSLAAREISPDLKIDIKNLCGNLRSALDYLAKDIRETFCPKATKRFYFPIFQDQAEFNSQMAKWFPDLSVSEPRLWRYLESIQPYNPGYDWLGRFNTLNNENKHGDLVHQTRTEKQEVRATTRDSYQVTWNRHEVTFGNGVKIGGVPVNPATQLPVPDPSQEVEVVIWVDFRFSGIEGSARQLLKQSYVGISQVIDAVYQLFPEA
jgi:hypothetical protein